MRYGDQDKDPSSLKISRPCLAVLQSMYFLEGNVGTLGTV